MSNAPVPIARYVRAGVLLGVLTLGLFIYMTQDARQPAMTGTIVFLRIVVIALSGAMFAVVLALRRLIARTPDYTRATRLAIVAWAFADMPAVFGAAVFFITGDAGAFFAGALFVLLAGLVIPSDLASQHAFRLRQSSTTTIRHDA